MHGNWRMLVRIGSITALVIAGSLAASGTAYAAENPVIAIDQPPDPLAPAQPFTSSITVTNTGDADAAPFTFIVTLPKFASGTPHPSRVFTLKNGVTCTTYTPRYGSTRKTCTVTALAVGAALEVATVKFVPPTLATFPYAGLTTTIGVSGPTNSTSAVYKWRQAGPANLVPSAPSVSPGTALRGTGPITVYGTVTDAGYSAAAAFDWRVDLPPGATNLAQPAAIAATTCSPSGNGFNCSTSGLANAASFSFTFTFTAPTTPGVYAASVAVDTGNTVAESDETDNLATSGAFTVPGTAANLTISAINPPTAGQYSTFTRAVTVSNIGGAAAANVSFSDYATAGPFDVFSFAAVPAGVTCSRYVTFSGRPSSAHYHGVRCNVGTIPAGGSVVVPYDLVVKNNPAGVYPSTLSASTTSYQDPASSPTGTTSITVFVPSPVNAPLNTIAPALSGNANTGSVLTTTTGTWIGAGTITYAYQWQRCDANGTTCNDIGGRTATSYTVGAPDVGATLRAVVTATNAGGARTSTSAPSAGVVGAVAPSIDVAPMLLAGLEKQPTFAWSVTTGTWAGTPTITYGYQWMRCNVGGGGCIDIAGAVSSSYVLQTGDVFHSVQVRVTATNPAGSGVAVSDVSPEIDPLG